MEYAKKVHAFSCDPKERFVLAGNAMGQLQVFSASDLALKFQYTAHSGVVEGIAYHPTLPYAASMAVDNLVKIWRVGDDGALTLCAAAELESFAAEGVDVDMPNYRSQSNALCFHPTEQRLLTRNGVGALLELTFVNDKVESSFCCTHFVNEEGQMDEVLWAVYDLEHDAILCTGSRGRVAVLEIDDPRVARHSWVLSPEGVHMCEPIGGGVYLLACDDRRVYRLDLNTGAMPTPGPHVTRDHLEQINYDGKRNRAYLTGFDRDVHQICLDTGASLGVVARAPFKCRWLHAMQTEEGNLILQCRNGALYKLSLDTKELLAAHRETPMSLWSAAEIRTGVYQVGGEGPEVLELDLNDVDTGTQTLRPSAKWADTPADAGFFTKRVVAHAPSGASFHARSSGEVMCWRDGQYAILAQLSAAVRDIAVDPGGEWIFAVCEDGRAYKLSALTGETVASFHSPTNEPLWALAHNPERSIVAVCERNGSIFFLSTATFEVAAELENSIRPKRAMWRNKDELVISLGASLGIMNLETNSFQFAIEDAPNTIEDFAWSHDGRFLALVTYDNDVWLLDGRTFAVHSVITTNIDHPHGMNWLSPERGDDLYPYEIMTLGRSGVVQHFRVHNRRLFHAGGLNDALVPTGHAGMVVS